MGSIFGRGCIFGGCNKEKTIDEKIIENQQIEQVQQNKNYKSMVLIFNNMPKIITKNILQEVEIRKINLECFYNFCKFSA